VDVTLVTVSALTPTIYEQLVGSPTVGTLKLTHLPPPLLFGRHLWSHYEGFYEFCMVGYIVFRLELPKSQKAQAAARQSGRAAKWNIEDIIAANLLHSAFKPSSTTILPSHFSSPTSHRTQWLPPSLGWQVTQQSACASAPTDPPFHASPQERSQHHYLATMPPPQKRLPSIQPRD